MCGKTVAKGVATGRFAQASSANSEFHRVLKIFLRDMMTTSFAAARINTKFCRGEHVLPCPRAGGVDVFAIQGVRQIDGTATTGEILAVQFMDAGKVGLKGALQPRR